MAEEDTTILDWLAGDLTNPDTPDSDEFINLQAAIDDLTVVDDAALGRMRVALEARRRVPREEASIEVLAKTTSRHLKSICSNAHKTSVLLVVLRATMDMSQKPDGLSLENWVIQIIDEHLAR